MTKDEKKEFEEFLKWKAEKAQQAASKETEEMPQTPVDIEDIKLEKEVASQTKTSPNSDTNKGSNNTGLYVLAAVMAIVLLFILVMALSNSKRNENPVTEAIAEVEEDSVAVLTIDEEVVPENNKVTWDFTIVKDDMYDTNNIWAEIKSDNSISQRFPYEGYTYAIITVRYMKKYGYDVIINISKGQIHGNRYNGNNYITARFDEGAPKKYYFNEPADGSSDHVFLSGKSDFIKRCKQAKDIKIDIPIFQAGRPTFTFHVDEPLVWRNE